MKERLKSIIDEGRQQKGVDIDLNVEKGEDGKVKDVNVVVPDTIKTMAALIDHLQAVGLKRNTDEYFAALKNVWEIAS